MRRTLLGAGLLCACAVAAAIGPATQSFAQDRAPPTAPAPLPFVRSEAEAAVLDLAGKIEEDFVFPDVARQYAAMLRANLAAGKYASFPDADTFAKKVTADLQAVHKDGHLSLRPVRPRPGGQRGNGPLPDESGVTRSGWLAKGVAYVDFNAFPGNDLTLADLRKFLAAHKDAKTLIIDARGHRGGGLAEMNLLFPELFTKETVLVDMDTRLAVDRREGGEADAFTRVVDGPDSVVRREHYVVPAKNQGALARAKVYLLVSKRTGSAGEHLALSLKRTKRATLIGESTYGAGHYGGFRPAGKSYMAFIPVGRTFDPDTGKGWEGVGVAPDIAVPADQALDRALNMAGVNADSKVALAALK